MPWHLQLNKDLCYLLPSPWIHPLNQGLYLVTLQLDQFVRKNPLGYGDHHCNHTFILSHQKDLLHKGLLRHIMFLCYFCSHFWYLKDRLATCCSKSGLIISILNIHTITVGRTAQSVGHRCCEITYSSHPWGGLTFTGNTVLKIHIPDCKNMNSLLNQGKPLIS